MCGIAGIYDSQTSVSPDQVRHMLTSLGHRGPDDRGTTCFQTGRGAWRVPPAEDEGAAEWEACDLVFAHVRLSIIDLSSAGHQPMSTPDGTLWITYNGEIYNYREVRKQLEDRGYKFCSKTDTEVVLYAYKEFGHACLEHFNGFFAFCIYDVRKKQLFMARDRLGLKPLKYYWDGKRFAFASEVKSLMQLPWIPRTIDPAAIDQYLSYRYIPSPLTGIRNICKLPAGCCMTLSLGKPGAAPVLHRYWLPRFGPKTDISYDDAMGKMRDLLGDSICMRLVSDVPLGVFLSGGIDSSSIVALLRKRYKGDILTFSAGFSDEVYNELPFARKVAEKYKTIHTELLVEPRPGNDLQDIVWHFDEPFGDPSAIPTYYLAKVTAGYVKVVLNGDGGDEVFAGYKRYRIHGRNRFLDFLPSGIYGISKSLSVKVPFDLNKKTAMGKIRRILESVSGSFLDTYPLRFSGLSWTTRQLLYKNSPLMDAAQYGWPSGTKVLLDQMKAGAAIEKLMAIDQITYLPDDILVKSDLAGMSHGIEARSPFLDYVFVEWMNNLPLSYKHDKRLLKDALREELPYDIIKRKKAGFNPPLAKWMRTVMKKSLQQYLLSEDSPLRFLDRAVIKDMYDLHQSGKANVSEPLWLLLALAVWMEKNHISAAY